MKEYLFSKILSAMIMLLFISCTRPDNYSTIIVPDEATSQELLAAKEVRRYVYQRTGQMLSITHSGTLISDGTDLIVLARKDRPIIKNFNNEDLNMAVSKLSDQEFLLRTFEHHNTRITILCGGDEIGTLYAAYRLVEYLGVRFYLHGDVIPDERIQLNLDLDEINKPLFVTRGIQPFHDFPEGPDWWRDDDYKAILAQLPKLKMNFFGLHTYPEGNVGPEPTVWIGLKQDLSENGEVKFSYPARHFTTVNGTWGYQARKTNQYYFGMNKLFDKDICGADYMNGMAPWPENREAGNILFNRTGDFFQDIFSYGRHLGIKICVGTETPLIVPKDVDKRLKKAGTKQQKLEQTQSLYEGMFEWIKKNYPIDYYWFWTPENWTWGGNSEEDIKETENDIKAAIAAAKKVQVPFTLATCGWVLGPKIDRTLFDNYLPKNMAMSCINRLVGFAPVDLSFARIKDRPKWAIPWLEDDPAMIIPQLWTGRMRRDAADALAYGCTGLIGIHWRTRILGPNVSALAQAAWEQRSWNPDFGKAHEPLDFSKIEGSPGALFTTFTDRTIVNLEDENVFRTLIFSMDNFYLNVDKGVYDVTLKFLEVHYKEKAKRRFGLKIQGQTVVDTLDIFAQAGYGRPLNLTFEKIAVTDKRLWIHFDRISDNPILAGIVIAKLDENSQQKQMIRKINCAGKQYKDFESDPSLVLQGFDKPRDLPVGDFYNDWAKSHFGENVAPVLAEIFSRLDGNSTIEDVGVRKANLPRPSDWRRGPGGLFADSRSWNEARQAYEFVDEMERLRPQVEGKGNLERFDYWLNNFKYLRAIGKFNCTLNQFDQAMEQVKSEKDPLRRTKMAREIVLPVRKQQIENLREVHRYLQATIKTTGSMGVVANWQQHNIPTHIEEPGKELAQILGEDLPEEALPGKEYPSDVQLIVPTVRTSLMANEPLRLKIILLGDQANEASIFWKPLAGKSYQNQELAHVSGGIYTVTLAPESIPEDFEYYIEVKSKGNETFVFPATAPSMNQAVVIMP